MNAQEATIKMLVEGLTKLNIEDLNLPNFITDTPDALKVIKAMIRNNFSKEEIEKIANSTILMKFQSRNRSISSIDKAYDLVRKGYSAQEILDLFPNKYVLSGIKYPNAKAFMDAYMED